VCLGRGKAQVNFQQFSELMPIAGVDIVGPLPESIQLVTPYSTGMVSASLHAASAQAFIRFLASPAHQPPRPCSARQASIRCEA